MSGERKRIMKAALDEFVEVGIVDSSLESIADRAGQNMRNNKRITGAEMDSVGSSHWRLTNYPAGEYWPNWGKKALKN